MAARKKTIKKKRRAPACRGCEAREAEIARLRADLKEMQTELHGQLLSVQGTGSTAHPMETLAEAFEGDTPPIEGAIKVDEFWRRWRDLHEGDLKAPVDLYGGE